MTFNFKSTIGGYISDIDSLLIKKVNGSVVNTTYPIWGTNAYGQFGNSTTTASASSPVYVSSHGPYKKMYQNYEFTIGMRYDNTLWAWGRNNSGYLGAEAGQGATTQTFFATGTAPTTSSSPMQVGSRSTSYSNAYIPTQWRDFVTGSGGVLAISQTGTLWTWGGTNANYIAYNYGSTAGFQAPLQVGTDSWIAVGVGYDHAIGIKADGTLLAWGKNASGQLGNNTTVNAYITPVQPTTGSFVSVAAGTFHTAAIKTNGSLWTWGYNGYGQIGDGSTTNRSSPVQVGIGASWVKVAAGQYHTMAIRTDGTLWAWGYNTYGQIGDGTTIDKSSPVQVGALSSWLDVRSPDGMYVTVALRSDGTLWTWGANDGSWGRLGDGTTVNKSSPVQVAVGKQLWNTIFNGTV